MSFTAVELIEAKRDGETLSADAIKWLIAAYTDGSVTDYQMSAMTMAIYFNGLNHDELAAWTEAMLHSGDVLDFGDMDMARVDKHSTGGVGDKISIPLAPLVASCGVAVPMMSGRGLGHTGGTLDKLESIPGFFTGLDPDRFGEILRSTGLVLAGQSETLVPADRKLYALRDSTATVPSIPLISSSIMSKKLAEGLNGLVLDVKTGAGAFMKSIESSRELARTMVGIGNSYGVETVALITDMSQPLGYEIGNGNEMVESIATLRGEGPPDITELTMALAEVMLELAGVEGHRRHRHGDVWRHPGNAVRWLPPADPRVRPPRHSDPLDDHRRCRAGLDDGRAAPRLLRSRASRPPDLRVRPSPSARLELM
jgi:pyrimidine-nucleoside phosphorylase